MVCTDDVKNVLAGTTLVTIVTVKADGTPHGIIVGRGEMVQDTLSFNIYRMVQTQSNLEKNKNTWIILGTLINGKPRGYRLTGTAVVQNQKLVFTATKADVLM